MSGYLLSKLTINLAAVRDNYRILADRCGQAECGATLKANAYGLGVENIAPTLYAAGARTFFVAYHGEALELSQVLGHGSDTRIYVLEGTHCGSESDYITDNIFPVLNTIEQIAGWKNFRNKTGINKSCAVHVDTGMNRLGMAPSVFESALDLINEAGVDLVLSHLGSADDTQSPHNAQQLEKVLSIQARASGKRVSLCNSAGLFLGSRYVFDLARPGVALYGANPVSGIENPMKGAVTLEARVRQIRHIDAGETVGYGADFVSDRPMVLGTLAMGYADGFPRSLGASGAYAVFRGQRAPLVGRVSMDFCVVDLSNLGDQRPKPDDYMELMGKDLPLDKFAEFAGTISHEVLTNFGARVQRIATDQNAVA